MYIPRRPMYLFRKYLVGRGMHSISLPTLSMIPKALVAASLRPLMLSILDHGESYGYAIIQRVHELSEGQLTWTDGTLYPVLHRLEAEGLIASTWRTSAVGRRRKYYRLTPVGQRALETERRHWLNVHAMLLKLWGSSPQWAGA